MTENEIKEILELLKASGMEAMLCDTPIGVVDNPVMCGDPQTMGDYTVGDVLVPRALVGMHPEFMVPVVGDSMIGAGYEEGDLLHVRMGIQSYDGDVSGVSGGIYFIQFPIIYYILYITN